MDLQVWRHVDMQILDVIGAAVIVTDLDDIVQSWNPAAETPFGWACG